MTELKEHFLSVPPPHDCSVVLAELTEDQIYIYESVLDHFTAADYHLPGQEDGILKEEERFWLSKECMLRYLRASKWVTRTAISRLEETLGWRRVQGLYDTLTPDYIEPELITGKSVLFGYDTGNRPLWYMYPNRQNTEHSARQTKASVFLFERCIDLMGPGVESLVILIDFADRPKDPGLGAAMDFARILQNHYPERLGRAMITHVPWLLYAFFRIFLPFLDPNTRQKVYFNPNVIEDKILTPDMATKEWGGSVDFIYNHMQFWPNLLSLCKKRRQEHLQNWKELGGRIGISEWDYKHGSELKIDSIAPETTVIT